MIIYLLTSENLRSNDFIKDFCFYFKPKGKSILLHGVFGSPNDTRFVSKRLSAYLSEELIVNSILNGDQRQLLRATPGGVQVRKELITAAHAQVDLVVLNCLAEGHSGATALDPEAVLKGLRELYGVEPVTIFPVNPRSPLGQQVLQVEVGADLAKLKEAYEEEAATIDLALRIAPAVLLNPAAFPAKP